MDIQAVEKLATLVAQSTLHEVHITDGQESIRIKNAQPFFINSVDIPQSATNSLPSPATAQSKEKNLICSPHIGWLRLAQDTLSEPLVKISDTVSIGQTIAYVGVLGKLEPVISDKVGVIQAVLGENEQIVEYGTPLFEVSTYSLLNSK